MKHLLKKISIIGAGSRRSSGGSSGGGGSSTKPTPPPPSKLEPPKIGKYNPYSSHNQVEIIDLLCDGPIHGLVNPLGRDLETENILQGIYLDDTQIATSTPVATSDSDIFNDYALHARLSSLGTLLERNVAAPMNGTWFTSPNSLWYQNQPNYGDILNQNQYVLTASAMALAYYSSKWHLHSIVHDSPNIRAAENWSHVNSSITFATFNDATVSYNVGGRHGNGIIPYLYQSDSRIELHYLGSVRSDGIVKRALDQFNTIKDNASINQYEREIIAKKITIAQSIINGSKTFTQLDNPTAGWWPQSVGAWLVIPITNNFNRTEFQNPGIKLGITNKKVIDGQNKLIDFRFYFKDSGLETDVYDCIVPEINASNEFTGKVYGFIAIKITTTVKNYWNRAASTEAWYLGYYRSIISTNIVNALKKCTKLSFTKNTASSTTGASKYNYNNILCEVNYGENEQRPLRHFNKVYLDKKYQFKLIGPWKSVGEVRRFNEVANLLNPTSITAPASVGGFNDGQTNTEGSLDANRLSAKGSYTEINRTFDEVAIPLVHFIENSETKSVIVSITINELTDTLTRQLDIDGTSTNTTNGTMENPGTKIPTLVTFMIETGKDTDGKKTNTKTYTFTIYGNIPSVATIDFGNPENDISKFTFIAQPTDKSINSPFELPTLNSSEINTNVKRYVRVTKISTETNSVLIRKEIFVDKITEIIDSRFSYPFSTIVGTKLDARNLSSIPVRSFDCRLKKVKIPSNYYIMENGYDIRYQNSKTSYESVGRKIIYDGDWDGTFQIGWTDNPAWILYDILTNKRYGLGRHVDEYEINAWELYKIGRYCDAVDDNGYFVGVPDGRGGLEPRFSCNILLTSSTKLFDAINIICNLFRGSAYFHHGEINFSDDRPKEPMALFNNTNVKDGIFNYITNKKDDIFNTVEVAYLDRLDNFKTKVELVEDAEDIRKRGPQKTVLNTIGVTSKSMARRIGGHIIWQTIKENQAIEFVAGLESLLCKPGDLILIDDELKTRGVNCGKILEKNIQNNSLRLSNTYDTSQFNSIIELYTPTGYKTREELYTLSQENRSRVGHFTLNSTNSSLQSITGRYVFSKYVNGSELYTGKNTNDIFCYYDDDESSWVFSTGFAYRKNNTYDKFISNTVDKGSFIKNNLNGVYVYNLGLQKRTSLISISSNLTFSEDYSIRGIYDNEIITESPRQITKYQISGVTTNIDGGSIVYLHPNNFNLNLLSIVEPGSPYRIGMTSFKDEVYKVISIREESQNEYLIVATKYDSGKWSAIENDSILENSQQIFYDSSNLNKVVSSITTPTNLYLDTYGESATSFNLTGSFDSSHNLFKIKVENKSVGYYFEITTGVKQFNITNLNDLGRYDLTVTAISTTNVNINSYPATTKKFVGYQKTDNSTFDRPYIETFEII
jgi:hypothetical protein